MHTYVPLNFFIKSTIYKIINLQANLHMSQQLLTEELVLASFVKKPLIFMSYSVVLSQGILYNLLPLPRHIITIILLNIELTFLSVVSSLYLSPENE